jgi:hypothetical protein
MSRIRDSAPPPEVAEEASRRLGEGSRQESSFTPASASVAQPSASAAAQAKP